MKVFAISLWAFAALQIAAFVVLVYVAAFMPGCQSSNDCEGVFLHVHQATAALGMLTAAAAIIATTLAGDA